MRRLDGIGLSTETLARVSAVWTEPNGSFAALAQAGGLDLATHFRGLDLRGWPLRGEDVRGVDFTGADLRRTGIQHAISDDTTIFVDALLEPTARRHLTQAGRSLGAGGRRPGKTRPVPPPGGYTKVRIPTLSDAELIDLRFVIDDPLALGNVTAGAPPTDEWLTYEGRYDVGAFVTCAFAHRHKRGYVFRDEQDRRYLIGHECGAKHLGLGNWQSFTTGREQLEDRAGHLRLIRDLADAFRRHRDWIAGLPQDPSVRAFDAFRRRLQTEFRELVAGARTAIARSDGMLTVSVPVRDHAAEERRREREAEARERYLGISEAERRRYHAEGRRAPSVDSSPIMKRVSNALGTLQGRSVFSSKPSLSLAMAELLPLVDAFLTMPRTPTTRRDLVEVTRNAKVLVARLLRLQESVFEAVSFFDQDNLERVARWADGARFDGRRFRVGSGVIETEKPDSGVRERLVRPTQLRALDPAPFDDIQATVHRVSDHAQRLRRQRVVNAGIAAP